MRRFTHILFSVGAGWVIIAVLAMVRSIIEGLFDPSTLIMAAIGAVCALIALSIIHVINRQEFARLSIQRQKEDAQRQRLWDGIPTDRCACCGMHLKSISIADVKMVDEKWYCSVCASRQSDDGSEIDLSLLRKIEKREHFSLEGLNNARRLKNSKMICVDNALVFEQRKCVILYESIAWVYKRIELGQAEGELVIEEYMVLATTKGKVFRLKEADEAELLWVLHRYAHKLPAGFIFGYGEEQKQKYKELRKRVWKARKENSLL